MRKKLFSLLALLCITANSAWAQYNVTKDATMSEGWTISPTNPVTTGTGVTATYSGSKHVKSVKFVANPKTLSALKAAINEASDLTVLTSKCVGKYVTAAGAIQDNATGAVGIITYISKTAVDSWSDDSRIFVLALTDASTGAMQYKDDTAEATYTDKTALNGRQATEHWHSWPSDFPASEAARNYGAGRPDGASGWFLPSAGQWLLGGSGSVVSDVMKSTLTANACYWTCTAKSSSEATEYFGWVYDYKWYGIGSGHRNASYYVRAAFVY